MSSSTSAGLGLPTPRMLPITGTWLLPFTAYLFFLSNRVVYYRLKNGRFVGDRISSKENSTPNPSDPLYIAIRSHANFLENVPLAFIFTAVAELNGGNGTWLNYAMGALFVIRIAHAELGLNRVNSMGSGRPIGYNGTLAFLGGMAAYGTWLSMGSRSFPLSG